MTPLEDRMYMALMAAKSFIQPRVRADVREMAVLDTVENALKSYQNMRTLPQPRVDEPMDWDSVREIPQDG